MVSTVFPIEHTFSSVGGYLFDPTFRSLFLLAFNCPDQVSLAVGLYLKPQSYPLEPTSTKSLNLRLN